MKEQKVEITAEVYGSDQKVRAMIPKHIADWNNQNIPSVDLGKWWMANVKSGNWMIAKFVSTSKGTYYTAYDLNNKNHCKALQELDDITSAKSK